MAQASDLGHKPYQPTETEKEKEKEKEMGDETPITEGFHSKPATRSLSFSLSLPLYPVTMGCLLEVHRPTALNVSCYHPDCLHSSVSLWSPMIEQLLVFITFIVTTISDVLSVVPSNAG